MVPRTPGPCASLPGHIARLELALCDMDPAPNEPLGGRAMSHCCPSAVGTPEREHDRTAAALPRSGFMSQAWPVFPSDEPRNGAVAWGVQQGDEFAHMASMSACGIQSGSRQQRRGRRGTRARNGILTATLLCGLAAGLAGCYVVSPYAYPAYVPTYPAPYRPPYVPTYPAPYQPPYVPPSPGPTPPQPGGPATGSTPSSPTPSLGPGASGTPQEPTGNCQMVTVDGHYETHVRQGGQQETIWIPTRTVRMCQ